MSRHYKQDEIARYSQPFQLVMRLLIFFHQKGILTNIKPNKLTRFWLKWFCEPLGKFCPLPDVLVIGASKCGSSSLAAHLSSHPDCIPPFYKEVRYFDSSKIPKKHLNRYRAHFPSTLRRNIQSWWAGRPVWTADFSPTYYDAPHAAQRVYKTMGKNVKLILLLRNPVDRAFSQYRFQRGIGQETEPVFEKALAMEAERIAGENEKEQASELYFSRPRNHFGYLNRSDYLSRIQAWHQYFDPSQLLIVTLEDIKRSPQNVYDEIFDFIGVPRFQISTTIRNESQIKEPLSPETRSRLVEYFREHNRQLSHYLGRQFDWDH